MELFRKMLNRKTTDTVPKPAANPQLSQKPSAPLDAPASVESREQSMEKAMSELMQEISAKFGNVRYSVNASQVENILHATSGSLQVNFDKASVPLVQINPEKKTISLFSFEKLPAPSGDPRVVAEGQHVGNLAVRTFYAYNFIRPNEARDSGLVLKTIYETATNKILSGEYGMQMGSSFIALIEGQHANNEYLLSQDKLLKTQ